MLTGLLIIAFGLLIALVHHLATARHVRSYRLDRRDLSTEEIGALAPHHIATADFVDAWRDLACGFQLPPGRIRPDDTVEALLGPNREFPGCLDDVEDLFPDPLAGPAETFGDLVHALVIMRSKKAQVRS